MKSGFGGIFMEFFEKKVRYLDYLEHGDKIKNGGFLKTEARGGECRVQIVVRGLYSTDTLQGEMYLCSMGEEYKVDTIPLHRGTGTYMERWDMDNLAGCGIPYADWDGIRIRLSEYRILQNVWREREQEEPPSDREAVTVSEETESGEPEAAVAAPEAEPKPQPEPDDPPAPELETEPQMEPDDPPAPELESEQQHELEAVCAAEPVFMPEPETAPMAAGNEEKRFQTLYEDKWTQLGHYYKTVHPFGDEREYLSVAPRDFIVLPERYQRLVANSFLLHGYYNYGHVLLGRHQESGEYHYYLGVPGIYHEREKQVARMFGFEGFEGAADPAAEGSFGYYMLRVDI